MRVAINHETTYRYRSPVNYSIQYLRLTPYSDRMQRVLSWRLTTPGNLRSWTDAFGNSAHVLVIDRPHQEIKVVALGEVEIADGGRPLLPETEPHPPELFLRGTRLTEADAEIRGFAGGFRPAFHTNPRTGLERLMRGIRETVTYKPGAPQAAKSARQALDARSGASQDHAHIFVACARSLGVPARYVSGYLCTDGDTTQMASHSWAEAWLDGAGWQSFDVANRMSNAKAHVRLAVGLDHLDAAPVKGVRSSGGEDLAVEVEVGDARRMQDEKRQQQQ